MSLICIPRYNSSQAQNHSGRAVVKLLLKSLCEFGYELIAKVKKYIDPLVPPSIQLLTQLLGMSAILGYELIAKVKKYIDPLVPSVLPKAKCNEGYLLISILLLAHSPLLATSFFPFFQPKKPFTIMLAPAGTSSYAGRSIDTAFERGISLQYAENLKTALENRFPHVRVVIVRAPGKTPDPLYNAQCANCLPADCYLSLHFYQETDTKPKVFIYQFSYGNDFVTQPTGLCFCTYDKAYLAQRLTTNCWGNLIKQSFDTQPFTRHATCKGVFKIPCKPLIGVQAPAFAFEFGIKKSSDAMNYIEPMMAGLASVVNL